MDWWIIVLIGLPIIALIIFLVCFLVKKVSAKRQREHEKFLEWAHTAHLEQVAKQRAQEAEERRKLNELKEKYKNSPYTVKAAEKFADIFIGNVKIQNRDVRTTTIECEKYMGAIFCDNVCDAIGFLKGEKSDQDEDYYSFFCYSEYLDPIHYYRSKRIRHFIDFTEENIRPLQSKTEMELFVEAIANKAEEIIRTKYPNDESGTSYTLARYRIMGEEYYSRDSVHKKYGISIKFKYSARNGFYSAPKEW